MPEDFNPHGIVPDPREVQIEAEFACPMVDGKLIGTSYKYTSDIRTKKLTVTYVDPKDSTKEITREFNIKDVKLSGCPVRD